MALITVGACLQSKIFLLFRLARYYNFDVFFSKLDSFLPYPVFVRLTRTVSIMMYLIHLNACAYYAFSDYSGIDTSPYVFNGHGNAYIRFTTTSAPTLPLFFGYRYLSE